MNEKNVTTKGVQNYYLIYDYDKSKSYDCVFDSYFFLLFQDENAEIFVDIDMLIFFSVLDLVSVRICIIFNLFLYIINVSRYSK